MTVSRTEVLIVGAGAGGLTLAIDLARRGVDFRLIEKLPAPFVGSKGKGLQPRTLEVFEDLGLIDAVLATGEIYPPVWTHAGRDVTSCALTVAREPTSAEPYPNSLMLPQWLTEAALRDRLGEFGLAPRFGVELTAFADGAESVVATVSTEQGEETIECRYLVGADGGRSFVRRSLGIGFPGERRPFRMVLADVAIPAMSREAWRRWPDAPGGQLSICPLAGTDLFQVAAQVPADAEPVLTRDYFQDLIRTRSGLDDLVVAEPTWTSLYTASFRLADRYRAGRVFLLGDAAHAHPPTGGQGLNTAVQDSYNLGWKLAQVLAGAPDALLDTYELERRPIASGVLNLSAGLLSAMNDRGDMRRGRETLQLDLSYRGSPLARELRAAPGRVQAGDRAPDAGLQAFDSHPVRLFEMLQGPQFSLLGYGVAPSRLALLSERGAFRTRPLAIGQAGSACVSDTYGDLGEAYDFTGGEIALVRPDGYLAVVADVDRADGFLREMSRWLSAGSTAGAAATEALNARAL